MLTQFGLAQLVLRLERERSYDLCLRLAEALGWKLHDRGGSFDLDIPGSRWQHIYFSLGALVDEMLAVGKTALGWQ